MHRKLNWRQNTGKGVSNRIRDTDVVKHQPGQDHAENQDNDYGSRT